MRLLIKHAGVALDSEDAQGRTSLLWAARNGHETVVQLFMDKAAVLESKADSRSGDFSDPILLEYATRRRRTKDRGKLASLLAECGVDLDLKDHCGRTALSWAACNGHLAIISILIANGADVESEDTDGRTSLWWAAEHDQIAVVEVLLKQGGADPEHEDKDRETALSRATYHGHYDVLRLLQEAVNESRPFRKSDSDREALLWWAVKGGFAAVVGALLDEGADPNALDANKQRPLLWAAAHGQEAVVKNLLEGGADLEAKDGPDTWQLSVITEAKHGGGQTPISWAARNSHAAVVALLLAKGADQESKSNSRDTPLAWAAANGHEAVVDILLQNGADLQLQGATCTDERDSSFWGDDKWRHTPLRRATEKGHQTVAMRLIDKTIETVEAGYRMEIDRDDSGISEPKDKYGRTLLSWASQVGHEAAVRRLLTIAHVQADSMDSEGRTPLSWAAEGGHDAVVRLLLHDGRVKLDLGNLRRGGTPLHQATRNGHLAIAKLLIEGGADVEARNLENATPLSLAAESGQEAVVEMLLAQGADPAAAKGWDGLSPLGRAAKEGRLDIVKLFLSHGAKPNPASPNARQSRSRSQPGMDMSRSWRCCWPRVPIRTGRLPALARGRRCWPRRRAGMKRW